MIGLIVLAASGLAKEAIEAARATGDFDVVGVLDDAPTRWGERLGGVKVLGGIDALTDYRDVQVLICAGKGVARARISDRIGLDESRYATVIHPSVSVPPSVQIGAGSVILAGVALTASIEVGRHVVIMPNVTLTHDDTIEDFATLCAGVNLGGNVRIGRRTYIGMATSIREGLTVGPDVTVGMGSVVLTDIPRDELWFGSPAKMQSATSATE